MSDPLLEAIWHERRMLRKRLDVLTYTEAKLRGLPIPAAARSGDRAPPGALREAIIAQLSGERRPIMSRDLKQKIVARGYSYRLSKQYFTTTLRGLCESGILAKKAKGSSTTYVLRRK